MGADPFTTSRNLKMCIITQFLLYHKIRQISISEWVLRKILLRSNQWIYKALQAVILLYDIPLPTQLNKKVISSPKGIVNLYRNGAFYALTLTPSSFFRLIKVRGFLRLTHARFFLYIIER